MPKLQFHFAFGFALLMPTQVLALPIYSYPTVSVATAERDLPCYMQTAQNVVLNLSVFCTTSSVKSSRTSFRSPAQIRNDFTSNDTLDGTYATVNGEIVQNAGDAACELPDDRDSRGRRCGKRAASERAGGR